MSDAAFMLAALRDANGEWVSQGSLLARSVAERGFGFTPHSRASDLRKAGHMVECKVGRVNGRAASFYRLAGLVSADPEPQAVPAGASTQVTRWQESVEGSAGASPGGRLFEVPARMEAPAWH